LYWSKQQEYIAAEGKTAEVFNIVQKSLLTKCVMNTSGATEKMLSKENLKQLISAKYASVNK
jgi:hypothetical protein